MQASHVNDLQDEVVALQQALLSSGLAHDLIIAGFSITFTSDASPQAGPSMYMNGNVLDIVEGTSGFRVLKQDRSASLFEVFGSLTGMQLPAAEMHSGIVTPAQITANQNDYNPGHTGKRIVRANSDASRNLTGLVAVANQRLLFINGGGFDIVLVNESASSSAANRFLCPGAANFTLNTLDSVELWYDSVSSRWRVLGF